MKKLIAVAVAPVAIFLLSASAQAADAPATQAAAPAELYCWKDKLYTSGDNLVCNWTEDVKDACRPGLVSNIAKNSIVGEPANAKRCSNGEWLVRVTKK